MSALVLFSKTDLNHGRRFSDRFSPPLGLATCRAPPGCPFMRADLWAALAAWAIGPGCWERHFP
ncbi:hypothetical protein JTE90_022796, partial [Oedothorax gibbosus]